MTRTDTKLAKCESCQIRKNARILKVVSRDREKKRYMFAVWRLYRYENVSPQQIAYFLGQSPSSVQQLIGEVFRMLCFSDKSCIFKDVFRETVGT